MPDIPVRPQPIIAASWLRPKQLLAAVDRDLAEYGRARVIGNRRARRDLRQLGYALNERMAEHNNIRWASGGFPDGRCWLHVLHHDIGHPYDGLYFLTEIDKPDWWRAMSVPVAGR